MQTTITSKSGKTYEVTTKLCNWKSRGRVITDANHRVVFDANGNAQYEGGGQDIVELLVDGKFVDRYSDVNDAAIEKKVIAAAKRHIEKLEADEFWSPLCAMVAETLTTSAAQIAAKGRLEQTADSFYVGQRVAVYARGQYRVGLVEKIGKTNVGVVYVTASTGNLWRKSGKFADVVILAPKPEASETDGLATEDENLIAGVEYDEDGYEAEPVEDEIGVPYAQAGVDGDLATATCPECGFVASATDHKSAARLYGEHFEEAHRDPDPDPDYCTGHAGRYEYADKRRLLVCSTCGRDDFEEVPYKVGPGHLPLHRVPAIVEPDPELVAKLTEDIRQHRLAGLRTERQSLRGRLYANQNRPELQARLKAVEAEMTNLGACVEHRAYDADNCPGCGTAAVIGEVTR